MGNSTLPDSKALELIALTLGSDLLKSRKICREMAEEA